MKKVGRPYINEDAEKLKCSVNNYFEICETMKEVPTISELSHFCGYSSRQMFTRQKYRSTEFQSIVLAAQLRILFWSVQSDEVMEILRNYENAKGRI